jgi:biopolymer transport protein ExbB/TolQ
MNAMMLAWKEGGWWMQPLGAVLVLTVYVIVERALWFQRSAFDAEEPFELLKERGRSRDLAGAITQCTLIRTPVMRVVLAGLMHLGKSSAQVKMAVDLAVLKEAPQAERRVAWLATFAQVAALLGFLGTSTGLVVPSSHGCRYVGGPTIDPAGKAEFLAGSISEALRCTQFGLLTTLIASVGYAALRAAVRAREREFDAAAGWVVALAYTHRALSEEGTPYRSSAG